jgi:glucuronate isomerase
MSTAAQKQLRSRQEWRETIREIPVFDTHTHMNVPGVPIAARDIWDIVEYFWFRQELQSVGYPGTFARDFPEEQRIGLFAECFAKARNTTWAHVLQDTFRTLYDLELSDAASVRRANEAIKDMAEDPARPLHVAGKLHIRRIVTNIEQDVNFPNMPGVGAALPIWGGYREWIKRLREADDPPAAGAEALEAVQKDVDGIAARGHRGMRVHAHAFERGSLTENTHAVLHGDQLPTEDVSDMDAHAFLAHAVLKALSRHRGMFAQLFLGIVPIRGTKELMGIGMPHTVPTLYPLFERYGCDFELIAGAPRLNMDIVQAARIYPNVFAGGLWWYNFRPSTYREAMQARIEAVPASKCTLLASDGRCIEWCYAKTMLVKNMLADFLHEQVSGDHINQHDALWVAREWLHDSAARRYV